MVKFVSTCLNFKLPKKFSYTSNFACDIKNNFNWHFKRWTL